MGKFVNPDSSAFKTAVTSEIYVDKTGLIEFANKVLGTQQAFICNTRLRPGQSEEKQLYKRLRTW